MINQILTNVQKAEPHRVREALIRLEQMFGSVDQYENDILDPLWDNIAELIELLEIESGRKE